MARSLLAGLIASGHSADRLWVSDVNQDALLALSEQLNVNVTQDNEVVVNAVDVLVLAVKPQIMADVAYQIAPWVARHQPLVISIAAGISQASLVPGWVRRPPLSAVCPIPRHWC